MCFMFMDFLLLVMFFNIFLIFFFVVDSFLNGIFLVFKSKEVVENFKIL